MSGSQDVILHILVVIFGGFLLAVCVWALTYACRRLLKESQAERRKRVQVVPKESELAHASSAKSSARSLEEGFSMSPRSSQKEEPSAEEATLVERQADEEVAAEGTGNLEDELAAFKDACETIVEVRRDELLDQVLQRRQQQQQPQIFLQRQATVDGDGEEAIEAGLSDLVDEDELVEGSYMDSSVYPSEPVQPNPDTSGMQTDKRLRDFLAGDGAVYAQTLLENVLPERGGPPESPPGAFTGELPEGWTTCTTPRGGTPYFWNDELKVSQWEFPHVKKHRMSIDEADETLGPFGLSEDGLPPGWQKRWSPATGKFYYENRAEKRVQHEFPEVGSTSPSRWEGSYRSMASMRSMRNRVVVVKPPSQLNSPAAVH
mmetsp:Transcript_1598/g.4117  ORF Transcript_1598/g.4117 Transcript_1598/m.4117 type:complete len:375 (+) Transcript_1598:141-1265(+)